MLPDLQPGIESENVDGYHGVSIGFEACYEIVVGLSALTSKFEGTLTTSKCRCHKNVIINVLLQMYDKVTFMAQLIAN